MSPIVATSLFLRDEEFKGTHTSKPQFAKVDYPGADIQEPEPAPGIYPRIGIK